MAIRSDLRGSTGPGGARVGFASASPAVLPDDASGVVHDGGGRISEGLDAAAGKELALLEPILVLLLAGLLAALVTPSVSTTLEAARLRTGAAQLRATFSLARTLSSSGRTVHFVEFDVDRGEYGLAGERRRIFPDGVWIRSIRVGDAVVDGERLSRDVGALRVRFFPDGSADETQVVLTSSEGGRVSVVVDRVTESAKAGI